MNFVWPNAQGAPGARITATAFDGTVVEIVNEPGRFGLERLISGAQRKPNQDGSFEMSWTKSNITVPVRLRIISNTQAASAGGAEPGSQGLRNLRLPATVAGSSPQPSVASTAAGVQQ